VIFPPTVPVTSSIDPSEVIAVGCALEALHLATLPKALKLEDVVKLAPNATTAQVDATSAPIGIVIPDGIKNDTMNTIVPVSTPLPARRRVELPLAKGTSRVGLEIWEGKDEIKVEKVEKIANGDANDEDDEDAEDESDEEEEEVRTAITKKINVLAGIELDGISAGAKSVILEIIIDVSRKVSLRLWESGKEEKAVTETLA
jgi:molecular chaperone DnaK (HSP70)